VRERSHEQHGQHRAGQQGLCEATAAEVGQGDLRDDRRPHRRGPRRARVGQLVEQRGDPRSEEGAAGDETGDGPSGGRARGGVAPPPDEQEPADGGEEVDRPVVAPQQRAGHEGEEHDPRRAGAPEHVVEEQCQRQGQQHHQRVHAGLGGVPHGEGREGEEEQRPPGDPWPTHPPAEDPHERQRGDAEHAGERSGGDVPVAEELHPPVEEPVEERRVAVVAQRVADLTQRQTGDVDVQRLVQP
jgi:hypothetical protein